ncbi:MAG: hypothetical protein WC635_03580 [Bacteriovorax sp.]
MKFSSVVLGAVLVAGALPSFALETDQFIASKTTIKDSAEVFNNYFNRQIDKAIEAANSKNPEKIKCSEVAGNVMNNLVGGKYFSISKISKFARTSPDVDRYPDDSVSDRDYSSLTFYEGVGTLLTLSPPFARTINVNGIYMGTDKLGHFSLVGRNYYHNYLTNLKNGMKKSEALEAAILTGFKTEKGILGYGIGGVLSFGDLEANYEGLRFAIDLCDGENPYIVIKNNRFEKNSTNGFNMKTYFNPRMDESYHFSFWRPWLYKKIKTKLAQEYCEARNEPMYIERISKYAPLMKENLNDRLIQKHLLTIDKFDRKLEDVSSICN